MPRRALPCLAVVLAALAAVPAAHAAAWHTPSDGGPADVVAVGASSSPRDAAGVLTVHGSEVSIRRTRGGRLGRPVVLDRASGAVFEPRIDIRPGGDAVVAWLAFVRGSGRAGNHRVFAARLPQRASGTGVDRMLTGAGESAYAPQFVPGVPGPLLVWERRTGPLESARWAGGGPPQRADLDLGVQGVNFQLGLAGEREGRVVAAYPDHGHLAIAISNDAARHFAPATAVAGSGRVLSFPPSVGLDSNGDAAIAWAQSTGGGPARVMVSLVPAGQAEALPAVEVAATAGAPSAPVAAPRELGGAFVGWVDTARVRGVASASPGPLRVRVYNRDGVALGPALRLGGPGETGRGLLMAAGATAFWTTPSGALRAQDIDPAGRPGRASTIDRGVDAGSVRVARGGRGVAYLRHGRARLALRAAP